MLGTVKTCLVELENIRDQEKLSINFKIILTFAFIYYCRTARMVRWFRPLFDAKTLGAFQVSPLHTA